jgi:hypothetical protein
MASTRIELEKAKYFFDVTRKTCTRLVLIRGSITSKLVVLVKANHPG